MSRKTKFNKADKAAFATALALLVALCIYTGRSTTSTASDDKTWQAKADSIATIIKAEQSAADSAKANKPHKKRKHKKEKASKVASKATPRNHLDEIISN